MKRRIQLAAFAVVLIGTCVGFEVWQSSPLRQTSNLNLYVDPRAGVDSFLFGLIKNHCLHTPCKSLGNALDAIPLVISKPVEMTVQPGTLAIGTVDLSDRKFIGPDANIYVHGTTPTSARIEEARDAGQLLNFHGPGVDIVDSFFECPAGTHPEVRQRILKPSNQRETVVDCFQ